MAVVAKTVPENRRRALRTRLIQQRPGQCQPVERKPYIPARGSAMSGLHTAFVRFPPGVNGPSRAPGRAGKQGQSWRALAGANGSATLKASVETVHKGGTARNRNRDAGKRAVPLGLPDQSVQLSGVTAPRADQRKTVRLPPSEQAVERGSETRTLFSSGSDEPRPPVSQRGCHESGVLIPGGINSRYRSQRDRYVGRRGLG